MPNWAELDPLAEDACVLGAKAVVPGVVPEPVETQLSPLGAMTDLREVCSLHPGTP